MKDRMYLIVKQALNFTISQLKLLTSRKSSFLAYKYDKGELLQRVSQEKYKRINVEPQDSISRGLVYLDEMLNPRRSAYAHIERMI